MSTHSVVTKDPKKLTLTIQRTVKAPQTLMWKCWTTPEHITKWWGPHDWTTTTYKMEVKKGGVWHYSLKEDSAPEDAAVWCVAVYSKVDRPFELEYLDSFSDERGIIDEGSEMPTNVTFTHLSPTSTKVTIVAKFNKYRQYQFADDNQMAEGFAEALDRLANVMEQ